MSMCRMAFCLGKMHISMYQMAFCLGKMHISMCRMAFCLGKMHPRWPRIPCFTRYWPQSVLPRPRNSLHTTIWTADPPKTNLLELQKLTQQTPAPAVYRSGQVRSGQVRSGQVRPGQVRSQVRSGHRSAFLLAKRTPNVSGTCKSNF